MSSRLEKIRAKWRDDILGSLPGVPDTIKPEAVFNSVVAADPTRTHKYVDWTLRAWMNGSFQWEDIRRGRSSLVAETLANFERFKKNIGDPSKDPEGNPAKRSLLSYKGLGELARAVETWVAMERIGLETTSSREAKRIAHAKAKIESHEIITESGLKIEIPMTIQASCELGRNTKWCTAATKDNLYTRYTDTGPLLIFTLPTGERFQGHIDKDELHIMTDYIHKCVTNKRGQETAPKPFRISSYISLMDVMDTPVSQSDDNAVFAQYQDEIIEAMTKVAGISYEALPDAGQAMFKRMMSEHFSPQERPKKITPEREHGTGDGASSFRSRQKSSTAVTNTWSPMEEEIISDTIVAMNEAKLLDGHNLLRLDGDIQGFIWDAATRYQERHEHGISEDECEMEIYDIYHEMLKRLPPSKDLARAMIMGEVNDASIAKENFNIQNYTDAHASIICAEIASCAHEGLDIPWKSNQKIFNMISRSVNLSREDVRQLRKAAIDPEILIAFEMKIFSKEDTSNPTAMAKAINEVIKDYAKKEKAPQRIVTLCNSLIPTLLEGPATGAAHILPDILKKLDFRPVLDDMKSEISPEKALYAIHSILTTRFLGMGQSEEDFDDENDCEIEIDQRIEYDVDFKGELATNIQEHMEYFGIRSDVDTLYQRQGVETDPELKGLRVGFLIDAGLHAKGVGPGHVLHHISQCSPMNTNDIALMSRDRSVYDYLSFLYEPKTKRDYTLDAICKLSPDTDIMDVVKRCLVSSVVITPDTKTIQAIREAPIQDAIKAGISYEENCIKRDIEILQPFREMPYDGQFSDVSVASMLTDYQPSLSSLSNIVDKFLIKEKSPAKRLGQEIG